MEKQICPGCKTKYEENLPSHCENCNYPFCGTKQEQGRFIGQQISMRHLANNTNKLTMALRIILIVWAAGTVALLIKTSPGILRIVVNIVLASVFLPASILAGKKPFISFLTAFVVFAIALAITGISNPAGLLSGIILKLGLLGALGYSIYNMWRLKAFYGTYFPEDIGK